MTIFLPLGEDTPLPQTPSFLLEADRNAQLSKVVQAIMKAKRIVVICGAGISVRAGIPDFRSQDGLFKTLKRDNPREALSSGKDLFDASVFHTEQRTSLFCQMMAQLADLSQNAEPTSFHHLLRALNDRGRLLRVYTQNIDAIEQKSGLSFGVPVFDGRKWRGRPKGKSIKEGEPSPNNQVDDGPSEDSAVPTPGPSMEIPRCIPLHGTLQLMHCQTCRHSFPLQHYLPSLSAGQPPECPECANQEKARAMEGKRPRGVGKLRPSVVLYNEAHHNGEGVGDVVQKDLIGSKGRGKSGADLLLVVGTSLKVPGTKRMVREFAKAVRSRGVGSTTKEEPGSSAGSSRQSPSSDDEPPPAPMKAVYLNLDFPVPTREWEGVFDVWVQGDAQTFADMLREEIKKEAKLKEQAMEKKKRREEEAAAAAEAAIALENGLMDVDIQSPEPRSFTSMPTPQSTPKRKNVAKWHNQPTTASVKRQKTEASTSKRAVKSPMTQSVASSLHSSPRPDSPKTPPSRATTSSAPKAHFALLTPDATPTSSHRSRRPRSPDLYEIHNDDFLPVGPTSTSSRTSSPNTSSSYLVSESVRARFAELRWTNTHRSTPYRSCHHVATSSIRSTLLDHERDFRLVSPPLVDFAHDGFRGDG